MAASGAINQGRQITLATDGVAPPNAIYLTQDDGLWIYCASSIGGNLRVVARLLLPDGSMGINSWDLTMNGNRSQTAFQVPLSEGFLMGIQIYTTNVQPSRGQVYASINVLRGNLSDDLRPMRLAQGYVTFRSRVYWPGGGWEDAFSGRGNLRTVIGTTPAPGAEILEVVPNLCTWRLIAIQTNLVASAAVANRTPLLFADDGSNRFMEVFSPLVIGAGTNATVYWGDGIALTSLGATRGLSPIVTQLFLPSTFRFGTSTPGLQAGDQYASPKYMVEEWL